MTGTVATPMAMESFGPIPLGTSKDWIEPMIGARIIVPLNEKLSFGLRGDASGFGIGSASDLTWNLVGGVDIKMSPTFDLKLGWRVLDIDYESGSGATAFGLDVTMHGPYFAGTIRF